MNAEAVLEFVEEIGILKHLPRSGWQFRGIPDAESIADHCYRMALLAMVLADVLVEQGVTLDANKVTRMALLHELAEARIGDIPFIAFRYLPKEAKQAAERAAIDDMLANFGALHGRYLALWEEFEAGTTLEARLVRAADQLELMIQVAQYEKIGYRSLGEFWANNYNHPMLDVHPLVREIMTLLESRRVDFPE